MRETIGHEVLAGAIGSASILGGAITSPLLAPAVDLVSAAVTAGIVAHAVYSGGSGEPEPPKHALRDAARRVIKERSDASLAVHVIDVAYRARARDPRALRSLATLVGRAFEGHARAIALGVLASWCPALGKASRVVEVSRVARTATANAEQVRALCEAALRDAGASDLEPGEVRVEEREAPPASGRFPIGLPANDREAMVAA